MVVRQLAPKLRLNVAIRARSVSWAAPCVVNRVARPLALTQSGVMRPATGCETWAVATGVHTRGFAKNKDNTTTADADDNDDDEFDLDIVRLEMEDVVDRFTSQLARIRSGTNHVDTFNAVSLL